MANYFDQFDTPRQRSGGMFDDLIPQQNTAGRPGTVIVAMPDGTRVSFPDDMPDDQIRSLILQKFPEAGGDAPDTLPDVLKSGGIGAVKGVVGLAGLPGDLSELGARGLDVVTRYIGSRLGVDIPERANQVPALGAGQLQGALESVTGPLYEPKTTAGKYAQTAGEFLPAIIGGPETLATKLATRMFAPAIASEAAGQFTEGTAAEPYARVAAALAGGAGASRIARGRAERAALAGVPSESEIKSAATAGYDAAQNSGVKFKPTAIEDFANLTKTDLRVDGINEILADKTFKILDRAANPSGPVTVNDIRTLQRTLGNVAKSPDPTERLAATRSLQALNQHIENIPAASLLSGTPQDAAQLSQTIKTANANYAAYKRSQDFNLRGERAQNNAAAANSGMNLENYLRTQVRQILNSPKLQRGYDAQTLDAFRKFNSGSRAANVLRMLGNALGGGGGWGSLAAAGIGHLAIPGLGVATPLVGFAAKAAGNARAARDFDKLGAMIRGASPLARSTAVKSAPQSNPALLAALRAALAAQPYQADAARR